MAINPLKTYRILIADPDIELVKVLRAMLQEMGFSQIDITTSGIEAYRMLINAPYDFLITEWNTKHMDGIQLLKKIRRAPDSPNPVLPVIMLTGRAEIPDVYTARDFGINEFVVKPFTAKTIFNRIQRIIEHPRPFVLAPNFIGPDRRSKGTPPPGKSERRTSKLQPQLQPRDVLGAMQAASVPRIWLPDFTLKYKLGSNTRLESLITDAVLNQAQAAVDAISDASLEWIKENLADMRKALSALADDNEPKQHVTALAELALEVNSRAGTFGYSRASEIAYMLYLFCRNHCDPFKSDHRVIIQKHIDVLQVILGNQMRGSAGTLGHQAMEQLKLLTDKFSE